MASRVKPALAPGSMLEAYLTLFNKSNFSLERSRKFLRRSQMYLKAHLVLLASFHFAHKTSLPLRMTNRGGAHCVRPQRNECNFYIKTAGASPRPTILLTVNPVGDGAFDAPQQTPPHSQTPSFRPTKKPPSVEGGGVYCPF